MKELFNMKAVEIAGHQIQAIDARGFHSFLGVGRDFSNWIAYFGDCDRLFRDNPITSVSRL